MGTAPFKAIALPAVYRANLEFQSHVPFQHSRTRTFKDSRTRGRRGFCTSVHSFSNRSFSRVKYLLVTNKLACFSAHRELHLQADHIMS